MIKFLTYIDHLKDEKETFAAADGVQTIATLSGSSAIQNVKFSINHFYYKE